MHIIMIFLKSYHMFYNYVQTSNMVLIWFIVCDTTFSNISFMSWWSVLLVEKTTDLLQVTDELYHIILQCCQGFLMSQSESM
jgi:hypothetical protein